MEPFHRSGYGTERGRRRKSPQRRESYGVGVLTPSYRVLPDVRRKETWWKPVEGIMR